MAAFDQPSFARAVQKREAKKLAKDTARHQKKATTANNNTGSGLRKKDKAEKDSKKENKSPQEMTMKKKLWGKLFKILTLKESKTTKCSETDKNTSCRIRRRSRSSQSSTPSNFEPMPTIYEEENEEADLISLQSFGLHKRPFIAVAVA